MRLPFVTRLALVLYVVAEIGLFVGLVRWLGGWPVFGLVLATGLVGGWLIQREGVRAWTAIGDAVRAGRAPERHDLASSRSVIISGFLLTLPGFVTDLVGLLLLVPVTRPLVRRLWALVIPPMPSRGRGPLDGSQEPRGSRPPGVPPSDGPVIEGEVVDPDDPQH